MYSRVHMRIYWSAHVGMKSSTRRSSTSTPLLKQGFKRWINRGVLGERECTHHGHGPPARGSSAGPALFVVPRCRVLDTEHDHSDHTANPTCVREEGTVVSVVAWKSRREQRCVEALALCKPYRYNVLCCRLACLFLCNTLQPTFPLPMRCL